MSSPIFDATFATGRFRYEEPMTTDPTTSPSSEPQDVRDTFMQVLASLVAAVSLLKSGGKAAKKAAPSDKMFDQMILDYERAIEQGRAALAQSDAEPGGEWRDVLQCARAYVERWPSVASEFVDASRDCLEAIDEVLAAPPRPDASGLIEAAEWPFGYQDTFSLISDATGLVGGHIGISVSKFEKAYNKLRARAADRSRVSEK